MTSWTKSQTEAIWSDSPSQDLLTHKCSRAATSPRSPSLFSWTHYDELNRLTRGSVSPRGHRFDSSWRPQATCPPTPQSFQKTIRSIRGRRGGKSGMFLGSPRSHLQSKENDWLQLRPLAVIRHFRGSYRTDRRSRRFRPRCSTCTAPVRGHLHGKELNFQEILSSFCHSISSFLVDSVLCKNPSSFAFMTLFPFYQFFVPSYSLNRR